MYNKGMFENNLAKLNNTRLKEELQNIPLSSCTNDIAFVQTLGGQIVFLKGEIPTDDTTDPVAYAKNLITDDMKNFECPFCKEQENEHNSIIRKSRVVAETDNFIVFPTTGGFVENYQLIVPK